MIANKLKKLLPLVVAASFAASAGAEFDLPGVEKDIFGLPKLDRTDTLGGIDADNNGVRDDIDKIINAKWPHKVQRQAARQIARAFRLALLADKSNDAEMRKTNRLMSRAINCAYHLADNSKHKINPPATTKMLRAFMMNTKQRFLEYNKYNAFFHGKALGSSDGDTCDYR